jgi:MYXO-CTERM domain-containing protein
MIEEPGPNKGRMFVNDLNGQLYILNKQTKQFTTYLNLNGQSGQPGLFQRFVNASGYANGLITFQFDPDYANNGKFYTVHMESVSTSLLTPVNTNFPGFNTAGYTTTTSIDAPGSAQRRTVLIEWTDTNINDTTFTGTARELFRMDMLGSIHPMGDIIFNPNAGPTDPDWRMMYISIGDGSAGESSGADTRPTPQRLDSIAGKVLRIRPDNVGANTSLTASGRYYIPNDNPFVSISNSSVRKEIYALGFRNPHRMSWDAVTNSLIVDDIGLHTWEEVNIVKAGGNYGYSPIEGNQVLGTNNENTNDPLPATIPRRISDTVSSGVMTPIYPVAQYGHGSPDQPGIAGDSVSSGFVYRGANIPTLYGKYVFGDITTGQLLWCDLDEMIAADDGNPATLAQIRSIDVLWDNPDRPGGETLYKTIIGPSTLNPGANTPNVQVKGPMFQIVDEAYHDRGGQDPDLPGAADVTAPLGRADIRWQVDRTGELFLLSKSDGMIRYVVEAVGNADFNNDGNVDGGDFLIWQQNIGRAGTRAEGDADGDGRVTFADLDFWKKAMPQSPPTTAVPEPAGAALAAVALAALARRRRA